MIKARVYRSSQRKFICKVLDSSHPSPFVVAWALANLLKQQEIVAGDFVTLLEEKGEWIITAVEERKNAIERFNVRERSIKVTAANIDVLIIVVAVSLPEYKSGLVDRYLVRSEQWRIPAILVFNKIDHLHTEDQWSNILQEASHWESLPVPVYFVSALNPSLSVPIASPIMMMAELKDFLRHRTAIFMGQSGVGKSRLISALTDNSKILPQQELTKVNKGHHTTSWTELVEYKELCVLDSPGIRSFSLEDLLPEDLISYFPDLSPWGTQCQFTNCRHETTSLGCFFYSNEAKDHPSYQSRLRRLESYREIYEELSSRPSWEKKDLLKKKEGTKKHSRG